MAAPPITIRIPATQTERKGRESAGQIMAAAKLRFNKKSSKYKIESYGNQYIKAVMFVR